MKVGPKLTRREREVLVMALLGLSAKDTAKRLSISHRTVEDYRATLMQKYGVSSTIELVYLVFRLYRDGTRLPPIADRTHCKHGHKLNKLNSYVKHHTQKTKWGIYDYPILVCKICASRKKAVDSQSLGV